jgi:hypothetical protein
MFSLLARRYPYLGIVAGVVLIVIGVVLHSVMFEVTGVVVLIPGIIRSITAWRKAGLAGGQVDRRSVQ